MGNKKKKDEFQNLKKRLLSLERQYGMNYNSGSTKGDVIENTPVANSLQEKFDESETNTGFIKGSSSDLEGIRTNFDTKVDSLRSELRSDIENVQDKIEELKDNFRLEGNDLREKFISKSTIFWVLGIIITIVGALSFVIYNNLANDISEMDNKIDNLRTNVVNKSKK